MEIRANKERWGSKEMRGRVEEEEDEREEEGEEQVEIRK